MDEFIRVATFSSPTRAQIIKGRLQSEGIECILTGELTSQLYAPVLHSTSLNGVKLEVKQSDLKRTIEILQENGYLQEEDFQPPKYWQQLDAITSHVPFINKLTVEKRILTLATLVIGIAVALYYFVTVPTLQQQILNNEWSVSKIIYKGKAFKPKSSGFFVADREDIDFRTDGDIFLPGINTNTVSAHWQLHGNTITVLKPDTLVDLYAGNYTISTTNNQFKMQSNTTTIYGILYRF
jgi:hypothetical protein